MDVSGADDGTDFRPFFDMVIGILFVLLILVAAQIYFQQTQDQTAASDATKREAALRRADIAAFLDALAGRLGAEGLAATADADAGTVLLPIGGVMTVDAAGLPSVDAASAGKLGASLADLSSCVTVPRRAGPDCADFARLGLDALVITTRLGAVPANVALPRDRFGDLGTAMLSAELLGGHPGLIGASNASGGRVVDFDTAPALPVSPETAETGIAGDLVLDFTFH